MPIIFQYLLKVSISLGIMYIFYQLLLRRLTFYNHNRWYLLGYSVLCFFISLINVGPILEKNAVAGHEFINMVPSVYKLTSRVPPELVLAENGSIPAVWQWLLTILITVAGLLISRLVIQLISFRRLRASAKLVAGDKIKFYQVNRNIIPFSFGNSIYINQNLHTEAELKEIIRHEFVHVKQGHTADIIWSEILCIINWYNPFAWLIKKAIRQNLEFIADNKVVANGIDRKQYQLLLLKVIGNRNFGIGAPFNFSSLKKRIVMMNKIKSTKGHLFKFLFILPLLAVVLLAFRNKITSQEDDATTIQKISDQKVTKPENLTVDSGKPIQVINGIPYAISANDSKAWLSPEEVKVSPAFEVWVDGKIMSMADANASIDRQEVLNVGASPKKNSLKAYGINSNLLLLNLVAKKGIWFLEDTIPGAAAPRVVEVSISNSLHREDAMGPEHKKFFKKNPGINLLHWKNNGELEVYLKSGKVTKYSTLQEFKKFESLYGPVPSRKEPVSAVSPVAAPTPVSPALPVSPVSPVTEQPIKTGPGKRVDQVPAKKNGVDISTATGAVMGIGTKANKPIVFVDGQQWPSEMDINILDADKIESINVYRGESAISQYGEKAKDGVIAIVTKKQAGKITNVNVLSQPAYYLNGKKITKEAADLIDPKMIKSIDVLKGIKAKEKYGEDGKNGVIEISAPIIPTTINRQEKPVMPAWDFRNQIAKPKKDEC